MKILNQHPGEKRWILTSLLAVIFAASVAGCYEEVRDRDDHDHHWDHHDDDHWHDHDWDHDHDHHWD